MKKVTWNNGLGQRERTAWLLLTKGEEIFAFVGNSIPNICVMLNEHYKKDGKWSNTTYQITLAEGVRHISGRAGWDNGTFSEGLGVAVGKSTPNTWLEMAECLGTSVPAAQNFLYGWKPKAAENLDSVESKLMELDNSNYDEPEMVTISFGSPDARSSIDGFWERPKSIKGYEAEVRLIDPKGYWISDNLEVVGITGRIISVNSSPGRGGGYKSVTVVVLPGTETEIPIFQTRLEKSAEESGLNPRIFVTFRGDKEKTKKFISNVERVDGTKFNPHEMTCGRDRKSKEVIRVSGDKEFFLGADPLEVWWYIEEVHHTSEEESEPVDQDYSTYTTTSGNGGVNSAMASAFAGLNLKK